VEVIVGVNDLVGVIVGVLVAAIELVGVLVGVMLGVTVLVGAIDGVGVLVGVIEGVWVIEGVTVEVVIASGGSGGATYLSITSLTILVLTPILSTIIFDPSNFLFVFCLLFKPIISFLRITNYSSCSHFL
jgi:hypothetical protein